MTMLFILCLLILFMDEDNYCAYSALDVVVHHLNNDLQTLSS